MLGRYHLPLALLQSLRLDRRYSAIDETKLKVKGSIVYVWTAIDVDSQVTSMRHYMADLFINALIFIKH